MFPEKKEKWKLPWVCCEVEMMHYYPLYTAAWLQHKIK